MHIGAHFILFYQDFMLLRSSLPRLHRWACCRAAQAQQEQETISLTRGEPCEGSISDHVKCAESSPDAAPLPVAPPRAPWNVSQAEGGMEQGEKRVKPPFRTLCWMNLLLPCSFSSGAIQGNWGFFYPRDRVSSCLPSFIPWVKAWGRCVLKSLICRGGCGTSVSTNLLWT